MSSSSSTHSEACGRRSTSSLFSKCDGLSGISHIKNVLYTLPHGNEASQSHNDFEAPTQRETNLQVSRMGQHCTLGIRKSILRGVFYFSVQNSHHNWGEIEQGRSNKAFFPKRIEHYCRLAKDCFGSHITCRRFTP